VTKRPTTQPEINEFRRKSLKAAALRVIAVHGYENATVERIAIEAGVSRGLVNHYFASKDDLLLLAYHSLMDRVTAETRKAALRRNAAVDQMLAIIDAIFGAGVFDQVSRDAYLAFWGASRSSASLRKATREHYHQYHRNMRSLAKRAGQDHGLGVDADRLATGLIGLIDGMWLQLSLGVAGVSPGKAVAICRNYVTERLQAPPARARLSPAKARRFPAKA
jgi:TetR/AcrR family transcriptional repressor of bet genes